jgi:hypothetical protein
MKDRKQKTGSEKQPPNPANGRAGSPSEGGLTYFVYLENYFSLKFKIF